MNIRRTQRGSCINYTMNGSVLAMGNLVIDLAERQGDAQVSMDITRDGNTLIEGLGGRGGYVACVVLPPKEYDTIETGEVDAMGNRITNRIALPLDTEKVILSLWRYVPENVVTGG